MSKNVILFLVLFVLVAGGGLMLLKNSATPVAVVSSSAVTTTTDSEKAATPAADKDSAKADEKKPADADNNKEADKDAVAKADDKDAVAKADDAITPAAGDEAAKTDDAKADDAAKAADAKTDTDSQGPAGSGAPVSEEAKAKSQSLLAPSVATDVDMNNALGERTLGDKDAPIKVIEYASMTCPHCARFSNDVFAQVKSTFIDTGKMYFVYRDYPLDTTALKAAMMARCADSSKYFDLVEVIFKNQEHWIKSSDPVAGLKQLGELAGMDESTINSCMANPELQTELLRRMQEAQTKFKVNATPTFVFNNGAEYISGDQSLEDFQKVIDKLSKKGN